MLIGLVVGLIGLLAIVGAIIFIIYGRRKRRQEQYTPPPLTNEVFNTLIFGAPPEHHRNEKKIIAHLDIFEELVVMDSDLDLVQAICETAQSTDADRLAKYLSVLFENRSRTVNLLCALVSNEMRISEHISTLFRGNSIATKVFAKYAKMRGIRWLHATIGVQINKAIAESTNFEVDTQKYQSGENEALNKYSLLTQCQQLLVAVMTSSSKLPPSFRHVFNHIKRSMAGRFPVDLRNLSQVVLENMIASVNSAKGAMDELMQSHDFEAIEALGRHMKRIDSVEQMQGMDILKERLVNCEHKTETVHDELAKLSLNFLDIQAAKDPDSQAAKQLYRRAAEERNSVAVGGFLFLRFIVAGISTPESYGLVSSPPEGDGRRLLVLIGKVLQNLSNNKEFGGKEAYMTKLNEFIHTNSDDVQELFDGVSKPDATPEEPSISVPPEYKGDAVLQIYQYCASNYEKIMMNLRTPRPSDSESASLRREQTAASFQVCMERTQNEIESSAPGSSGNNGGTADRGALSVVGSLLRNNNRGTSSSSLAGSNEALLGSVSS
eukprot:TRINITY_DN2676_c0_g2_i2.p1 TRINITY_DN2676_c0_g2~~TRINITY_DN2676_c0_g2_i2.p1  ORF type:complete len:550 (-),score=144.15 TRINITY_DN2676_c0_g2_i2:134-1783(-)